MKEARGNSPGDETANGKAELQAAPVGDDHGHQGHHDTPQGERHCHQVPLQEGDVSRR